MSDTTTMPDYATWAWAAGQAYTAWLNRQSCPNPLEEHIKSAFEQGRALGQREGREMWWVEQDADLTEQEQSLHEWTTEEDYKLIKDFERASLEDFIKWDSAQSNTTTMKNKNPWKK